MIYSKPTTLHSPGAVNPHAALSVSPVALARGLRCNRQLILQITKREVFCRCRSSVKGLAWSFFNPLLMLVIYTFVFFGIFKARWGIGGEESKVDFAIVFLLA